MDFTKEDLYHLAKLANLELSEKELETISKSFSTIINFVNQLAEIDTTEVEFTSQIFGTENVFREDLVEPSLSQKEALINALNTHKGFFMAKLVFTTDEP